jgi:hypothetical protein
MPLGMGSADFLYGFGVVGSDAGSKLSKCFSVSCMSNGVVSFREFNLRFLISLGYFSWNVRGINTEKNGNLGNARFSLW